MDDNAIPEADIASAWNRNAARWSDSVRAGHDMYRELHTLPAFLAFMPDIASRRVLDLGCGEGRNTREFARRGGYVTGIDLSEALIERARVEEERAPLGIRYAVMSFADMRGIADGSVDCALSTMALMDSPDFDRAMRETARVLVPGGTLCFSVLHPCFTVSPVGRRWLRDADGSCTGLFVADYFDETPRVEWWTFSKAAEARDQEAFEVPRFPRTLSGYVNAVCAAGLRIVRMKEPRPDEATAAAHPWLARHRCHAPLVLMVEAVKA